MYKCEHFTIQELVDPQIIEQYAGRENLLWSRFNPEYLKVLDQLRNVWGPIVVNGYFMGKRYTESGARLAGTRTGAALSMHKLWAAFDLKFTDSAVEDVFKGIKAAPQLWRPITRMEDIRVTPTWLHIDFGNPGNTEGGIYVFRP